MADPSPPQAKGGEADVGTLSLSELRRRLVAAGVDYSGFLEKRDFVDALRTAMAAGVRVAGGGDGSGGGGAAGGAAGAGIAAPAPLLRHYQDAADLDDVVEVMEAGDPSINAEVRNDQLVALTAEAAEPGAQLRISEHLWQLRPKEVATPAGTFVYLGIAASVDLPAGFTLASRDMAVPMQADNLPEEKSFRVFAFDEALCLGYTDEEDGITPR
jgi:hypothetical protein